MKNRNIISKKRRSKVTDYAALRLFYLNNSADPNKMPPDMAFHVGLHSLQKNLFTGFQDEKGKETLYSKTCVRQPLSKRPKIGFQGQLSLNAGQSIADCRMLQREHSAILSTFITLPFVIKIFVSSIFEWPLSNRPKKMVFQDQGEHSAIL